MSYTNEKRYSLKQVAILLAIAFSVVTALSYAAVTIPNTFTSGTTISSSQMNDNFTAMKTAIDANSADISALKAVRTGHASVSSLGAAPEHSSTATYRAFVSFSTGRAASTGTSDFLIAPIQIPDGATITGISYTCYDNDPSFNCVAYFNFIGGSNDNNLGSVATTGQSTSNQTVSATIPSHVVNNAYYSYVVYMSLITSTVGSIVPINFTVTYTQSL